MGTTCASLVADLFLFRYERSLSPENQADILSIPLQDTLMIYLILIKFTLYKWLAGYILLNFNQIKLILLILKGRFRI